MIENFVKIYDNVIDEKSCKGLIEKFEISQDKYETINEHVSGCDVCSDYDIVQPYLALTCDGEQCTRQINDHAGVGIYFKNNNEV